MQYQEKLEKLNAELRTSGASHDSMRDLFSMQLNTEKMRLAGEEAELSEQLRAALEELRSEARLRVGLIEIGVPDPDAVESVGQRLNQLMVRDITDKLHYQNLNNKLNAKLMILDEESFIESFVRGVLGETLDEAFENYANQNETLGSQAYRAGP